MESKLKLGEPLSRYQEKLGEQGLPVKLTGLIVLTLLRRDKQVNLIKLAERGRV